MKGSIGATVLTRAFSTDGRRSRCRRRSIRRASPRYLYEEVAASPHVQLQFGGRVEHATFDPAEDEPARDFTNFSGSLGLLLLPNDSTTVAFSLARASRNPALEELYFHGPHAGNNAFENGDPDLESEHALGFDASLRWRGARGVRRSHLLREPDRQLHLPGADRRGRGRPAGDVLRAGRRAAAGRRVARRRPSRRRWCGSKAASTTCAAI